MQGNPFKFVLVGSFSHVTIEFDDSGCAIHCIHITTWEQVSTYIHTH